MNHHRTPAHPSASDAYAGIVLEAPSPAADPGRHDPAPPRSASPDVRAQLRPPTVEPTLLRPLPSSTGADTPVDVGDSGHPPVPDDPAHRPRRTTQQAWSMLALVLAVLVCGTPIAAMPSTARPRVPAVAQQPDQNAVGPPAVPADESVHIEHIWPTRGVEPAMMLISWQRPAEMGPRDDVHLTWTDLGDNYADWTSVHAAEGRSAITVQVPHGTFDPCFTLHVVRADGASGAATPRQCVDREELG